MKKAGGGRIDPGRGGGVRQFLPHFFHRRRGPDFASEISFLRRGDQGLFQNGAAMQHKMCLPAAETALDSMKVRRGDTPMGLARPINTLMFCAAFAFVGAVIIGVLP